MRYFFYISIVVGTFILVTQAVGCHQCANGGYSANCGAESPSDVQTKDAGK